MKNIFLFIAIASLTTFGLSSCKKCTTCTATKGGIVVDTSAEYCAKSKDVDSYKASYKTTWELFGATTSCN